ncbi:MAG: hypothetical protein V3S14_15500 [Anaerolineae bacterium]
MLKARQVDRALTSKLGFERRETHHRVYRLYLGGRLVARTFISHGERELSDFHVSQMARQMRLRKREFMNAVRCPLEQEEYYALLQERLKEGSL